MADSAAKVPLHRARYWRIVRFFAGVFADFIWWGIILRRVLGRRFVERGEPRRMQRIARSYRALAVELGGVLIKLGQFLSVRVEMLPREVTAELAGLQDEVPPVSLAAIQPVIEAEYQRPLDQAFAYFAPRPQAAASLAQVHEARLPDGTAVVVKVQRPQIEEIVDTDLRAIRTAANWLKRYRPVRRRVDLDRLYDEFNRTTRCELDFVAEGKNAEQFAENFRDDDRIRVPHIYPESSTPRVLVMENVASIKIADYDALEAAGIDRKEVAQRLVDAYMKQVFLHNFVHADPHPGNLFVEPLPPVSDGTRPFKLVFVDFGMVATIPERVRQYVRDWLLGFATRDAGRVVRAYQGAGVLLPGADIVRLEQMEAEIMRRFAGLTVKQAQEIPMEEWEAFASEYRDILYEMPFQFPTDLLFTGRAVAILFGMANSLDSDFDPWTAIRPFAEQMAAEEGQRGLGAILQEVLKAGQLLLSLPGQADLFFREASHGQLTMRTAWTPEAMRSVRRVERAVNRLAGAVIFAALLLAGAALYTGPGDTSVAYVFFGLAGVTLLVTLLRR